MKKNKVFLLTVFSLLFCNAISLHAEDFGASGINNTTEMLNDFSMDMMMQQEHLSMDAAQHGIDDAESTNFMNHDLDHTMNFFFDELPNEQISSSNNPMESIDAFQDGNWSNSFNDYFNNENGLTQSDINFYTPTELQGVNENNNEVSTNMPELEFANDESISSINGPTDDLVNNNLDGLIDNTSVIIEDNSLNLGNNLDNPLDGNSLDDNSLSTFDITEIEIPSIPVAIHDDDKNSTIETPNLDGLKNSSDDDNPSPSDVSNDSNNNNRNNDD